MIVIVTDGNERNRYIDSSVVLLVMVGMVVVSVLHQIIANATIPSTRTHNSVVGSTNLLSSLANIMPFVYTYVTLWVYHLLIVGGSQ